MGQSPPQGAEPPRRRGGWGVGGAAGGQGHPRCPPSASCQAAPRGPAAPRKGTGSRLASSRSALVVCGSSISAAAGQRDFARGKARWASAAFERSPGVWEEGLLLLLLGLVAAEGAQLLAALVTPAVLPEAGGVGAVLQELWAEPFWSRLFNPLFNANLWFPPEKEIQSSA